jgi:hypothetical protein
LTGFGDYADPTVRRLVRSAEKVRNSTVVDLDLALAVDGALGGSEAMRLLPEISDAELVAIDARASTSADSRDLGESVGHGVALHAGDEVVTAVQQGADDLACAVQGVGDHDGGLLQ